MTTLRRYLPALVSCIMINLLFACSILSPLGTQNS